MTFKVYSEGKLLWSIEGTDHTVTADDVAILPKSLALSCSLSAESFDNLFFAALKTSLTHAEAYQKAEKVHEEYFEKRKYSDYDTFKSAKSRRLNKK